MSKVMNLAKMATHGYCIAWIYMITSLSLVECRYKRSTWSVDHVDGNGLAGSGRGDAGTHEAIWAENAWEKLTSSSAGVVLHTTQSYNSGRNRREQERNEKNMQSEPLEELNGSNEHVTKESESVNSSQYRVERVPVWISDANHQGSDQGSDLGNDQGSDLGSDRGSDPGSDRDSDRGSDLGNNQGSDLGSDRGNDLGSDVVSDLGSDKGKVSRRMEGIRYGEDVESESGVRELEVGRQEVTSIESGWSTATPVDIGEEEYDYDLEEALNTFNWAELLPALIVYSITFVFGVTGNFLIIVATTSCRRRSGVRSCCCCCLSTSYAAPPGRGLQTPSPTNVFLASLASADLLLILICIPVKMAKLFSYTWTMGVFLCKFVYYMQNVSTICSVLTLTAISLERYYAIVHPMKAKYTCTVGQATKIVLAIWVASLLLAVPILFVQAHLSVGVRIPAFWCYRDLDNVELWRFHEVYLLLLVLILPTCVMAGAYASICWEIWKVMRRRYHMTGGMKGINTPVDDPLECNGSPTETTTMMAAENIRLSCKKGSSRARRAPRYRLNVEATETESGTVRKVIKMLVIVVLLFVICWAPVLIDNVLIAYQILPGLRDSNSTLRHMGNAFHLMSYFNSCINPIVYGFMSKSFRVSFRKVLCKCCHRRRRRDSGKPKRQPSTTSQTRTTSVRFTADHTRCTFAQTQATASEVRSHDLFD
ncbi:gastrin/cholecystokinin type B receptor-like [Ischnura elegans]|uniref:gastrin/cholecystokinin type B receptor-like n=1 Tax=Ischnura elegans TaxID=197161 RepID=UPI001ED88829|nr:gastrin/cholecystokinin type B receptor-like [Ischnura elegans]